METSDNAATSSPAPTSTARRSGRVTKAPAKFTPDAPAAHKRKRNSQHDDEDDENQLPDEMDEASDGNDDDAEDSPAEEPQRATKRKKKPSSSQQSGKSRKPAAKKPKINGDAPAHEPMHAAQLPSRPKKAVRIAIAQREGDGLYGAFDSLGYPCSAAAHTCSRCCCSRHIWIGRLFRQGRDGMVPQVPGRRRRCRDRPR